MSNKDLNSNLLWERVNNSKNNYSNNNNNDNIKNSNSSNNNCFHSAKFT